MIYKYLVLNFIKSNKLLILKYIISLLLVYPFEAILLPKINSKLINQVKKRTYKVIKNLGDINVINSIKSDDFIGVLIKFFIILIVLECVNRYKGYIHSILYPKYKMWLRIKLFENTLEKKSNDFEEMKVGKEIMRLEDLIFTIKELVSYCIVNFLPLIIISISVLIYLFVLDFKIGMIMFIEYLILIGMLLISYKHIKKMTLKRTHTYFSLANNIDNSYTNISNILINNQEKNEIKKNNKFSDKYRETNRQSDNYLNNLSFIIKLTLVFTLVIITYISYLRTNNNTLTAVQFTTILIIMMYIVNFLSKQTWYITMALDRLIQIQYHKDFLEDIFEDDNGKPKIKGNIKKGNIEFRNISYKYKKQIENEISSQPKLVNSKKYVFKNFSLDINSNDKIALVGNSGSGKSTLMKLLIKFNKLENGQILVDNTNINDIDTKYLRDKISYINQNTLLFDENVYYNINYGNNISKDNKSECNEKIEGKIDALLKKYNLYSIYDKLQNQLHTKAGPRGTNLSLGMQKVTIIMRGILKKSKIIIFDEPLAGIDQKTRVKLINLIVNETKNKTLIIITHDKEILPYMDRIININNIQDKK